MTTVRMPISKFKAACTKVLREVGTAQKRIEITNHGKVVALVSPPPARARPVPFWGSMRGTSTAADDLVAPAAPPFEWRATR